MTKDLLALQKKDEKKRASEIIGNLEIGKLVSERRQKIAELLNIHQMEEKAKARERLMDLKSGKKISDIMGEYEEVVDLSPPRDEAVESVEVHPINKPFSYVRVVYDNRSNEYIYQVLEPTLSVEEQKIFEFLKETLIKTMDIELTEFSEDEAREYLRKHVDRALKDYSVSLDEMPREKIMYYIIRDFLGYGKIDVLMHDPMIEDISCDAPRVPIYIYHRNYESVKTNVMFGDEIELDSFVIQLAQKCGRHISIARPLMDATMPDGSRIQACLSREVSSMGSNFTIRRFREEPFTPSHLVEYNTINPEIAAYFWMAIENGASAVLAGGTASGKTTSLNALSLFIPPQMKIISIEDTREINLPHPNWIASITREGTAESGEGSKVGMFDLLKAALRQRPEYILVGEIRGQEAVVLFQAMATGHTVYSTMHADSIFSVVHRLEGDPINIPRIQLQALNIVAIQGMIRIGHKRVRRIKKIVEIVGIDPTTDDILTNEVFSWNPRKDSFDYFGKGHVLDQVAEQRNWTDRELDEEFERRRDVVKWIVDQGIKNYVEVGEVIAAYYKDPERILKRVYGDGEGKKPAAAPTSVPAGEDGEEGLSLAPEPEYPEEVEVEEIPAPRREDEAPGSPPPPTEELPEGPHPEETEDRQPDEAETRREKKEEEPEEEEEPPHGPY
ncbi:MAG TPA: secretion system protein E [Thermoplasmatales archaeon]|nr:type II/IV secretion system ATPase subunit [Candidatus Thermoplasmatota archaeon]HDS58824.1 secretion system protein E [Thermoplasmatales archaeon]